MLIADDDVGSRVLLRQVLERAGFVVAGEATNGAEAVRMANELQPDAITMDLEMPVMDGAAATRAICLNGSAPVIVVIVSGLQSKERIAAALEAGARSHVTKRDVVEELPQVLRALLS